MSPLIFVVSDYSATGEGRTLSLLITYAYPRAEDYEESPRYDFETATFYPGKLKATREAIALREMEEQIGNYFNSGSEILSQKDFLDRYRHYIPEYLAKRIEDNENPKAGNLYYFSTFHINFS